MQQTMIDPAQIKKTFLAELLPEVRKQFKPKLEHARQSPDIRLAWDYWLRGAEQLGKLTPAQAAGAHL
jgi:hypothetical protein